MAYPSPVHVLENRIRALATAHPTICSVSDLPRHTHEGTAPDGSAGRVVPLLQIGTGTGGGRPRVLIVAAVAAGSPTGFWRMSGHPAVQQALRNHYFDSVGLPRLGGSSHA